ncbi:hypothetical protein BJ138DRAFT_1099913 [Hygrophoropsis aurantiaca]|uniref:Uncharacterized protein n=1 Tax=Hygrophoropsis aurantiaca TaxID=72124 RepID=A0ACB8AHM4_9AGAM|nr:hypothetical protein BJ138DRAFT_1099913 [Hygrophoropsis aurantiaca]
MKFFFSKHDIEKADISDERGRVLYEIRTKNSLIHADKTTITKVSSNPFVLANIEWHSFHSSTLRFNEMEVKMSEFFPSERRGRIRFFAAPDGRKYKWRLDMKDCIFGELDECGLTTEIAMLGAQSAGGFFHQDTHFLEVSPSALPLLDTIVMTFVCLERSRKELNNREESREIEASMDHREAEDARVEDILDH